MKQGKTFSFFKPISTMPSPLSTQIFDPVGDLTSVLYQNIPKAPDGVKDE
jgi:hypothetical protein